MRAGKREGGAKAASLIEGEQAGVQLLFFGDPVVFCYYTKETEVLYALTEKLLRLLLIMINRTDVKTAKYNLFLS